MLTFTDYEWFPWSICNGCGMPAGNAYPSGHLVPSPILGLANAPIVETKFLELAMSLHDFSPRIPLGTFSILLYNNIHAGARTPQAKIKYICLFMVTRPTLRFSADPKAFYLVFVVQVPQTHVTKTCFAICLLAVLNELKLQTSLSFDNSYYILHHFKIKWNQRCQSPDGRLS